MNWISRIVFAACVAAGLAPCVAVAQVTWTGTTGNGDWSTAGAFAGSGGGLTLANGFSQAFVFAGTPAIVSTTNTLAGGTATSVTFNSGASAYTLSGSAITLAGNIANSSTSLQTINLSMNSTANRTVTLTAGGGNVTLNGSLSGAGGYILAGSGTLLITGSNSYEGNTNIGSGSRLVIGNQNALGQGGSMTFGGNGGFDVTTGSSFTINNNIYLSGASGTFHGSGNLALTGTLQFGGSTRTLTVNSGTLTTPQINAEGTTPTSRLLIKAGAGTLVVTGAAGSNFQGGFQLNAGTLIIGHATALGTGTFGLNGGSFDVTPGASLTITNSGTLNNNTTFLGSGNLTMSGTMTTVQPRNITTLGSGTLTLASLAGTRNFQKDGAGTLVVAGSSSLSGHFTHAGGSTIFGNSSAIGSGSFILSTGTVSSSVVLTIANATGLANDTTIAGTNGITFSGSFTNTATGVRALTNNLSAGSALLQFTGPVVLRTDANYLNLAGSGNTTISGTISGGSSAAEALRITSAGTTTLASANTYSGTTRFTAAGGSLVLGNDAALGSSVLLIDTSSGIVRASTALTAANAVALNTDANFGGTENMTFGAATNVATSARQIVNNLQAGQTLTFTGTTALQGATDSGGRTLTVAGSGNTTFGNTIVNGGIGGSSGLTINSTGTTTLQGVGSYAGPTTVNAGVLMLSNAAALGSGNLRLDTGGVVALNAGDLTSGTGGGAGQVRIVTSGGFAAFGSPRIVAFGGTSAPTALTWGDGVFLGSSGTFTLGAPGATDTLDFRNAVALGSAGTTRQVLVNDGPAALEGTMSGVLSGAANLRKIGPGALRLAGVNTFTGTASIGAGVLEITATTGLRDVARVVIDGGATFRYAGTSGTFAKPITVTAASGTGTIENTGGGTLTLSGAISKDNSVLRLSGGVFNVTGVISGATVNASDLLVTGTSTVTLSAVNTYNGPTFVNQSSTLIVGVAGAVPDNSFVTVGDGGSTGTLALAAGVSDAIGGLAFGSAGGTLRIATNSTSGPLLTTAGTMTLSGGTLDLAGSGSTAGLYNVLSGGLVSGEFASVTGTSAAYRVIYSNTAVDYQQRAVLGAVSVTSTVAKIISGGTAAFTYTVANAALSGGQDLSFTGAGLSNITGSSSGTAAAATTTSAIVGLAYTGTAVGLGQQGTFTVSGPDAFGTTSTTGTVSIDVLNHSLASFQSTSSATLSLDLGTFDGGSWTTGSGSFGYSVWNIASGGFTDIETAGLEFYDVVFSSGDDVFSTGWSSFANLVSGSSADFTASVTSPGSLAPTSYSGVYTLRFRDQQDLSGAINTRNLTLTLNVVVVPEPASLALAAAGIGAASLLRARRRRPA